MLNVNLKQNRLFIYPVFYEFLQKHYKKEKDYLHFTVYLIKKKYIE